MEGGVGSFPRACVCVQKCGYQQQPTQHWGKDMQNMHLRCLFKILSTTYTVSGCKHSLVSENITILGHLTENSTFSLLSSPP